MQVTTFLMFEGRAEEALTLYVSLFPGSRIVEIDRYGAGEPGAEGSVRRARFELAGRPYFAIDSPVHHGFTFTPAISLFVDVDDREQLDRAFDVLSDGGMVLMPPGNYGFSQWFTWLQDRFGVSWQLNLAVSG